MRFKAILAAASVVAMGGAAQADDGPCSEWREAGVIGDLRCEAADGGAVIGGAARATEYAQVFPRAFAAFADYFAPSEQKVALVVQSEVSAELTAALAADGYKPLPWIDNETKAAMLRDRIVAQVEAQTASLPEAQRAAVVQQALAKAEGAAPAHADPEMEDGAIAHEIGHLLFNRYFDGPDTGSADRTARYGSSAPDWLDEAAAVALENDAQTRSRYVAAREAYDADGTVLAFPLDTYLSMEHPLLQSAQALKTLKRGSTGAVMLSGDEADAFLEASGGNPAVFYRQTRMFIDYLMETSGDPRILNSIAQAYRDGGDLSGWLTQSGGENGLPETLDGLEIQFENWARARLAAISADPVT
ncbi:MULTISPECIES: hypothetical protein [unclassified Citromicrobium]|uniref:hypothetical protein n=1 Tax=unclassified Citromicrobium TaxID=2630544 RepID=UPI001E34A5BD|nr:MULTISPECIES: hypothetical protein [unclassified Citromicrobium]|tara:strand:- start:3974 stop:5053 length:1080 start_codon:yes stop_codon:yes gene_type:complete